MASYLWSCSVSRCSRDDAGGFRIPNDVPAASRIRLRRFQFSAHHVRHWVGNPGERMVRHSQGRRGEQQNTSYRVQVSSLFLFALNILRKSRCVSWCVADNTLMCCPEHVAQYSNTLKADKRSQKNPRTMNLCWVLRRNADAFKLRWIRNSSQA